MSLENRVNKTLRNLKSLKRGLVSNIKNAAYLGLISLTLIGGAKSTRAEHNINILNQNNDSSFVNPSDLQEEFVASPELGYVIKTRNDTDINLLNNMLKSSGETDIKQIGGEGHKNLSIILNYDINNNNTIKALKTHSQIQYASPLFSVNGETIAVIPEIVAKIKEEGDYNRLEELCSTSGLAVKKKMDFTKDEYLIEVSGNDANAVFESVKQLNNSVYIEWAAPNLAFQPILCGNEEPRQFIPNDELFPLQWHLNNTGQSGGTPNADINAPEAWALLGGGGDPNITIAVLDTGVDYNHPDLFDNIWVNKNIVQDTNLDGIIDIHDLDLDGNRLIDSNELNQYGENLGVIGWDFLENDNSPYPSLEHPSNTHGTAVAGLAAARGNNNLGVTGVAYNCKIMPIRINDRKNFTTYANMAASIRFAAENGADIINCSWGFPFSFDPIIHSSVIDVTEQRSVGRMGKGCVFLAAAGNTNDSILFPAKYPEVIAIGLTNKKDEYKKDYARGNEIEIVAPGENVWTTDLSGEPGYGYNHPILINITENYTNITGTSYACPITSGAAALVLSANPNLNNNEVRRILSRYAKDLGDKLWDEFYGNGRVDAYEAVKMALNPPEPFLFVDDDSINDPLLGSPDISDPLENGSVEHPFDSIQKAIKNSTPEDIITILPGVYTGKGNYDIDFYRKAITIHSRGGPESCIIDCQKLGRGFLFIRHEKKDSILEGLTITNGVAYSGGGIICGMGNPTIKNCIFKNNFSLWYGGGIFLNGSSPTLINCTFSENSAELGGGGGVATHAKSDPNLINCIFWNDVPEELLINFIYDIETPESVPKGDPKFSYSNIQGGWPGEGNIDTDPLFADPNNRDYHLKSQVGRWNPTTRSWVKDDVTSPCIDAGNPGSSLENELLSIPDRPNEEVYNSRINMGAYGGTSEASFAPYNWALPADLNNDGIVNFKDFAVFSKYWRKTGDNFPDDLNKDGKVDIADLSYLTGDWLKESEQCNKE